MRLEIIISIVGAIASMLIALTSSFLAHRNNLILQTRKLKEEHYIQFIESLHNLASSNDKETIVKYTFFRDKLFIIASESVIKSLIEYEEKAVGVNNPNHDEYLRKLVIEIRKDLKIKDKNYPKICLKKY